MVDVHGLDQDEPLTMTGEGAATVPISLAQIGQREDGLWHKVGTLRTYPRKRVSS